jgi:hypothetical protein
MIKNILKWEYFLMVLTVVSAVSAMGYAGKAYNLQRQLESAVIIEHLGQDEEIVIRRGTSFITEWEPRDGEVYQILDEALHER